MLKKILILPFLCGIAFGVSVVQKENYIEFNDIFMDKKFSITQDEIFKCEPKINGTYEFIDNGEIRTIKFYPKTPLIAGKKYNCSLPDGGEFSFSTNSFGLSEFRKIKSGLVVAKFNDFVDIDELKSNLNVYKMENLAKNDITHEIRTADYKTFFIDYNAKMDKIAVEISNSLKSKFGIKIKSGKILKTDEEPFVDNKNAINLTEVSATGYSYDDGRLGIRLYFKDWLRASSKFVRIKGVSNFSISEPSYCGYYRHDESIKEQIPENANYYIDIKSDEFLPNENYEITLLKGFGDNYTLLREDLNFKILTQDRKPFIAFSDEKKFVPKSAVVSFKASNLNEINVMISKLLDQNLRYFLNFDDNAYPYTKEILSQKFDIGGAKNEVIERKINFDFKGYTDGIYKISVAYKDGEELKTIDKIVYLSDISATATLSQNGILILTSRLSSGEILPKTNVLIYSDTNEIIYNDKTDKNGILKISDKDFLDKKPKSIFIQNGKESAFLIFNNAVMESEPTKNLKRSFLYLASDLINPNEQIQGVFILKNSDFSALKGVPIKLRIFDPKNIEILSKGVKTDDFGVVEIDEKMGEMTGIYRIDAIFENKVIASKNFSVENFIPNRIKNDIITDKKEYFGNEFIKIKAVSNYLLGAPSSDMDGNLIATMFDKKLKFDEYKDFSFENELLQKAGNTEFENIFFRLDKNGEKELIIAPLQDQNVSNAYDILLNFSVNDGGKMVNAYEDVAYFPYKSIIGISANKRFTKTDDSVNFQTILLDSAAKKPISGEIDIEIYKKDYDYVFNGDYYAEQLNFVLMDSFKTKNSQFDYKFKSGGDYLVVAHDYLSGSSASIKVDVSGWGYYGKLDAKSITTAKIVLEKTSFKPGETIKGIINSPIENGILSVSLVSDDIADFVVKEFKQGSGEFELKVPQNFTGGHISASIFRPATPTNAPLRTFANLAVKVDNSSHKSPISLFHDKSSKNGETTKIIVSAEPNSKVVLFAADMGILNIINQQELDAFKAFDTPIYFAMRYYDIYNDLSTYFTNADELKFGGDMVMTNFAAMKRDASPVQKRKESSFVIMKSGKTNEQGTAEFELKFPSNFNSKVRISALSVDDKTINSTNSYIDIKDEVVIKPSELTYLVKNDKIDFSLTLMNTTNSDKNLTLKIENSPNLNLGEFNKNINLKALSNSHEKFSLNARDLGNASLNFIVQDKDKIYKNKLEFSIISQFPASKFFKSGFAKSKINLDLSDESYKNAFVNVSATPNAISFVHDLNSYPYGCTEQITSKMVALNHLYQRDKNATTLDKIKDNARVVISRLKNDGSFGYWSAYGHTNEYASVYAADILLEFDEKYNFIGENQRKLIYKYLKTNFKNDFLKTYANFILNRHKQLPVSEINFMFDNLIYDISLHSRYMMAHILKTNNMQKEFDIVLQKINSQLNDIGKFDDVVFDSSYRNIAFALFVHALTLEPNQNSLSFIDYLTNNFENIKSTQERAFIVRAFDEYFKNGDTKANFALEFDGKIDEFSAQISRQFALENPQISIIPKDEKGVFYSVLSFGYEKMPLKHKDFDPSEFDKPFAKFNPELKIFREFTDTNGKKVDLNSLKVGDRIFSKIKVYSNFWVRNLAIDEAVSSCFETVNERLYPSTRTKFTQDKAKFNHKEYLFDRVLYFPSDFSREITIFTPLNVVISGECSLPAVKAEYMQDESLNDYDLETLKFKVSE